MKFYRSVYELKIKANCILELVFDKGDKRQDLMERELEFKSGSENEFYNYDSMLENMFNLRIQPLSKIARAMKL